MPKKKKTKKSKKIIKLKKSKIKPSIKSIEKKVTNTGQDDKPEIKKVKKQATEKRIYNIIDFISRFSLILFFISCLTRKHF